MHTDTNTPARAYEIDWDMGTYGPFATHADARAYQRDHQMTGSSIVPAATWAHRGDDVLPSPFYTV